MSDPLLLGVDIGTSSTKGVLVDARGAVRRTASRPHALDVPAPGRVEEDAERAWWQGFVAVCRELCADGGERVAAIGVSGHGPCVQLADAAGRPLRPAISYGVDTRAAEQIARLRARLGARATNGVGLTSQSVGPKLLWLREHEPDLWERGRRVFTSHTYVVHRLTGAYVLDAPSASMWDPLWDDAAQDWDRALRDELVPGVELPRVVPARERVGEVAPAVADQLGIPAGTPVVGGCMDYAAELVGCGVTAPGDCAAIFGSTLSLSIVVDRPVTGEGVWAAPGLVPGTRTVGGVTSTAGSLLRWLDELLGSPGFEALAAQARAVGPGSDGLLVLPYFSGERSPIFDPRARGVMAGLSLHHGPGHIYRALLEAIAMSLRHMLDQLAPHGVAPPTIVASGGGTRSGLLVEIAADATGIPHAIAADESGAPLGAALLAGEGIGLWAAAPAPPPGAPVTPDPAVRRRYDQLYEQYLRLDAATRPIVHDLGRIGAPDLATDLDKDRHA